MKIRRRLIHWFEHLIGWNTGKIISWSDDDFIYIGFECDECGKIDQKSIDKVEYKKVINQKVESE